MVGPGSQHNKDIANIPYADATHRPGIKSLQKHQGKADRLHAAKQQRDKKKADLLEARRTATAPTIVALLPLSDGVDVESLWQGLLTPFTTSPSKSQDNKKRKVKESAEGLMDIEAPASHDSQGSLPCAPCTVSLPHRRNARFTFIPPPFDRSDPLAIVELGRSAEVVLCAMPGDRRCVPVDEHGFMALSVLRGLGLPSCVAVVQLLSVDSSISEAKEASTSGSAVGMKERSTAKKAATEAFSLQVSGEHKVFLAENTIDFKQIARFLADSSHTLPLWRQQRSHVMVHQADIEETTAHGRVTLRMSGYIRNMALSAAQLLHIPTAGDFQIDRIETIVQDNLWASAVGNDNGSTIDSMDHHTAAAAKNAIVIARCPPEHRESLARENETDPLDAEQTWPTEAELEEAEASHRGRATRKRRLPVGTSDYQAAWIVDGNEGEEEEEVGGGDYEDDDDCRDGNDVPMGKGERHGGDDDPCTEDGNDEDEWERAAAATDMDAEMMNYDEEEEERDGRSREETIARLRASRRAEEDDAKYPDEVETPIDKLARERFARYRGLKSFRTSPWDPREDLPQDYARVFAFENFKRTQKRAKEAAKNVLKHSLCDVSAAIDDGMEEDGSVYNRGAVPGMLVRVCVADVPLDVATRIQERVQAAGRGLASVLSVWGLLQHEAKLSVVNFSVRKAASCKEPVANKEKLLFVTGLRSFFARPIFSTDEHGADKHKMERFLHDGRQSIATVYAPISYPPLPLLAFKVGPSHGRATMVATGSLRDCNPDRVVLKKIVLAGYPVRVHKSKAVVRYMFHSPDDVRWFRPVELWTKQGRRGRIREPVGTHGSMKCIFDGAVSQQDSVCMSLYKRAYPKWPEEMLFA